MSIAITILYAITRLIIKDLSDDTDMYIIAFISNIFALVILILITIFTGIPTITTNLLSILFSNQTYPFIASLYAKWNINIRATSESTTHIQRIICLEKNCSNQSSCHET